MIQTIFGYFLNNLNYFYITLLMTIESSFIPFPSEVVMIPAGYLVYQGNLNLFIVIFCGILGSIFGALVNYFIGYKLGRSLILKYKKFLFINTSHLEWSEKYFKKHGNKTTFFCRLIPVVRQYISIPAGFSKMNMKDFIIYTAIGAGIWVAILTFLGYYLGLAVSKNIISIFNNIMYVLIGLFLISFVIIIIYKFYKKHKHI